MKRLLRLSGITAGVGIAAVIGMAAPALADTVTPSDYHAGDVCTTGCDGSASFVHYGDHLYVWDNFADHHSAVAEYTRSDSSNTNRAWNHYGAFTRLDHNMDIPEGGWIRYRICLGEYDSSQSDDGDILADSCSAWKSEGAG